MPVVYRHQPDEAITWQTIAFDEQGEWWAGVHQCAARVALATALLATAVSTTQAKQVFSYHQDDPAGFLAAVPDDLPWQNQVAPVQGRVYQNLPYLYDAVEIVPQPPPFIPDDDSWKNPVPSTAYTVFERLPLNQEDDFPTLYGALDEDFWTNPVLPAQLNFRQPYLFHAGEIFPQPFQPDEDFWMNPAPAAQMAWKTYVFNDRDLGPIAAVIPPSGCHYIPVFRRRRR